MLTDAHTTDERPGARASEGRTPPPPLRARWARSRALRFRFGREGSVAAAASRRLSPSPRARVAKLPARRARAPVVDDPRAGHSCAVPSAGPLALSPVAAPMPRAVALRAYTIAQQTRMRRPYRTPRVKTISGGAPIALSRARSISRSFPARSEPPRGEYAMPIAPRRLSKASRAPQATRLASSSVAPLS